MERTMSNKNFEAIISWLGVSIISLGIGISPFQVWKKLILFGLWIWFLSHIMKDGN
jgi:hypothetical protein